MARVLFFSSVALLCARSVRAQEIRGGGVEFGTATAAPGEDVGVPVYITNDWPLRAVFVVFTYDFARLQFLKFDTEGSAAADVDPLALQYNAFDGGQAVCGISTQRSSSLSYRLPPAARQHIGTLRFRIDALAGGGMAAVTPSERITATAGGSIFEVQEGGIGTPSYAVIPATYVGGGILVEAPSGPRPVGDLACEQLLDRVELSFTPSEPYDQIAVERNGATLATLPGTASGFRDPLPGLGAFHYAVIARRGGASSVPARCEILAVSPAAPPVEDLQCGDGGGLSWGNPVSYERLIVFRNGEQIAVLPGAARSFTDPGAPQVLTVYTVIGELEGFRSPESSCHGHGVWMMEIGDVLVPPGATRVLLPIYVTNSTTINGFDAYLNMDQTRFRLVKDLDAALTGTVGRAEPEFFQMGNSGAYHGAPAAGILYDYHAPRQPEKDLPVGLRQHVLSFPFEPQGAFAEGESFAVSFINGSFSINSRSQEVEVFIPGQIRFGAGGLAAVRNLQAKLEEGGGGGAGVEPPGGSSPDVLLSWQNGSSYEGIQVERNGAVIAEVAGQATSFRDAEVPGGVYTYKVVGLASGRKSFPTRALVSTLSPPGAFLRGDANRDRKIDIADAVATLNFLFYEGRPLPCEDAADSNDDGRLELTDAVFTIRYLFLATTVLKAPGSSYPWFDPTPDGLTCKG